MKASLNERLSSVKWGEHEIGKLFEKQDLKRKKATFDKDLDISRVRSKEFSLPLVNAKDGDNGIMYYGRPEDFESATMTIDIVNDGAISTGNAYSQPQRTGVLYNAYLIKPKFNPTTNILHFFTTAIYKSIKTKFGYEFKASWERVKKESIFLPESYDGIIDFTFMESFIAELEAERIAELKAYLTVSGLDDEKLSVEEEKAIADYGTYDWGTFNLEELFGKSTRGKRLKSEDRIPGTLPFVTAGEAEEGVSAFIGNQVEVFEKNTTTIDMFGSAKYRSYRYGGDDHIAVVHTEALSMKAAIFVTSSIHKAAHTGKFDYGHNFYAKDADALHIMLPTKDGKPDYHTMELLISAVQKLVIQDVVRYADRKIAGTKAVIQAQD